MLLIFRLSRVTCISNTVSIISIQLNVQILPSDPHTVLVVLMRVFMFLYDGIFCWSSLKFSWPDIWYQEEKIGVDHFERKPDQGEHKVPCDLWKIMTSRIVSQHAGYEESVLTAMQRINESCFRAHSPSATIHKSGEKVMRNKDMITNIISFLFSTNSPN